MSEKKKDLKAFLSKQSKKGKKPAAAAEPEKTVEEETKVPDEVIKADAKVEKAQKADSEDEELDDQETNLDLGIKIKDMKDIKVDNQQDEMEKKGYGLDVAKAQDSKAQDSANTSKTKKTAGDITFGGGRPMKFGRKKAANQIDGFDDGLGDIDDDGKIKKNKGAKNTSAANEEKNQISGASGGREFINFGSKPRDFQDNKQEESKTDFGFGTKAPGVKPTFKRREGGPKEFKNTNDDEIRPSYDFKVSYKSHDDKNENGEKRERRPRDQKDKGVPLDTFNQSNANDEDEFTFVTGRQKRAPKAAANKDSDDDNEGFQRSDKPKGGRGGFFKNSKKAE